MMLMLWLDLCLQYSLPDLLIPGRNHDDDDVDGLVDPLLAVFFTPGPFDSLKKSMMMMVMMVMLLILIVVLTPGPFDSWKKNMTMMMMMMLWLNFCLCCSSLLVISYSWRKNERFKGSWSWLPPPEISKVHTIIVC
jgi:hypothetical protein